MQQGTPGRQNWGHSREVRRPQQGEGQASASDKQTGKGGSLSGWVEVGFVFFSTVLFPSTDLLSNWMKGIL